MALLEVHDLKLKLGKEEVLRGINFHVEPGKTLAIIGESGSGKTLTAQGILGLIPLLSQDCLQGSVLFQGENLLTKNTREMQKIRGAQISMIFQDPGAALNPTMPIGAQIAETLEVHTTLENKAIKARVIAMLERVGIADAEKRQAHYPHQFSGGQKQRIMIAMALIASPKLLIADEPTSSLDVTLQIQILRLLKELQEEIGMAILLITHDMGVVASVADSVAVMHHGQIIEFNAVEQVFYEPSHPYTKNLLEVRGI